MAQDPNLHWGSPYGFVVERTVVILHPMDKHIRVNPVHHHELGPNGGTGEWARWEVKKDDKGFVRFKSVKGNHWMRIHDGGKKADCGGMGGKFCLFKLHPQNIGVYKLESVEFPGKYIAVDKNGVRVGDGGPWCRFEFFKEGAPPAYSKKYMFAAKNIVIIEPRHPVGNLKVTAEGEVSAGGGRGEWAHWEVEPHDGGKKCKIKSVKNGKFLRIHGGKVDCGGVGGPWTMFKVHQVDSVNHVRLESEKHPGQFIAVNEHGHIRVGEGGKHCLLTFCKN